MKEFLNRQSKINTPYASRPIRHKNMKKSQKKSSHPYPLHKAGKSWKTQKNKTVPRKIKQYPEVQ